MMKFDWIDCKVKKKKLLDWWKQIDVQHQAVMVQVMWQETMHHTEACLDVQELQNWNE